MLGRYLRLGVALLGMAMVGILSPLILIPEQLFNVSTFAPTLAGQYVLKDVVLLAAGRVVTANVLGARMVGQQEDRPLRQATDVTERRADRGIRPGVVPDRRAPGVA